MRMKRGDRRRAKDYPWLFQLSLGINNQVRPGRFPILFLSFDSFVMFNVLRYYCDILQRSNAIGLRVA